jgi:hypothetical protein
MTQIQDPDDKSTPQVSRREAFGLGSAALAAVLAAASSRNASAAPQDSNALANHNAPNETDPGPQNTPLSERVRAGLYRAKAQGTKSGKPIGRPRIAIARDRVVELRAAGLSWREIAQRAGASVGSVRRAYHSAQQVRGLLQPS